MLPLHRFLKHSQPPLGATSDANSSFVVKSSYVPSASMEYIVTNAGDQVVVPQTEDLPFDFDSAVLEIAPTQWFRADNVTTVGTSTTQLKNKMGGGTEVLSLLKGTLPAPTDNAGANNKPTIIVGASAMLQSNLPASTYTFLHNATNKEIWFVQSTANNGTLLATLDGSNNAAGSVINRSSWTSYAGYTTYNSFNAATPTLSSITYFRFRFVPSPFGGQVWHKTTPVTVTTDSVGAISSAVANQPLTFFASPLRGDGTNWWSGSWAETLIFNRHLTASEVTTMQSYIAARYGLV